jgi:hypothetical protein
VPAGHRRRRARARRTLCRRPRVRRAAHFTRNRHCSSLTDRGPLQYQLAALDPATAIELFEASASPAHGGRTSPTAARPRANPLALIELPLAGHPATRRGDPLPLTDRLAQAFAARFAELPESARWLPLVAAVDDEEKVSEVLRAGGLAFGSGTLASDGLEPAADAAVVELEVQTVRFRYR